MPQEGRIKTRFTDNGVTKDIDFLVSCLPTLFGEKIVMSLLDKSQNAATTVDPWRKNRFRRADTYPRRTSSPPRDMEQNYCPDPNVRFFALGVVTSSDQFSESNRSGDVYTVAKSSRLGQVLSALRLEEGFLEAQLGKVRDAIGALGGVGKEYQRLRRTRQVKTVVRNVRKMSAAQKKAVSARMKKYWAERRRQK